MLAALREQDLPKPEEIQPYAIPVDNVEEILN
jgi:hypothetical protein